MIDISIWRDLKKRFHVGGEINQTTRWLELIAMLIFLWFYKQELETSGSQKVFRVLFGIEEE